MKKWLVFFLAIICIILALYLLALQAEIYAIINPSHSGLELSAAEKKCPGYLTIAQSFCIA